LIGNLNLMPIELWQPWQRQAAEIGALE